MHFLINHPELQDNIVDTLKVSNFKNIINEVALVNLKNRYVIKEVAIFAGDGPILLYMIIC